MLPVSIRIPADEPREYTGQYLMLNVHGTGEIDFLSSLPLLENAFAPFSLEDRSIARHQPREAGAKKISYLGTNLRARDVFDIAWVLLMMSDELIEAAAYPYLTAEGYARTRLRIETRRKHRDAARGQSTDTYRMLSADHAFQ